MREKNFKERFTIQFSGTDPAHIQAVELLNRQGRRSKAQYIVNAILHYESCGDRTNINVSSQLDIKAVEAIVSKIIMEKGIGSTSDVTTKPQNEHKYKPDVPSMNTLDNDTLSVIAGSVSSFRNKM